MEPPFEYVITTVSSNMIDPIMQKQAEKPHMQIAMFQGCF